MKLFFASLFFVSFHQLHAATICYFSLNNEKEFHQMKNMSAQLNRVSKEKIDILEFVSDGDNSESAFLKMVESKTKCDGLVISGHHTGSFGGARVKGTLNVDFMEKLSCDPKHKDFFNNIKALWLQGCRTLGVSEIATQDTADQHSTRVYDVRDADGLSQGLLEMNREFSATLDQDNPLSSRYLRVFPRATTFGWTKTAPGEGARSELSIPFHIAQMARKNDDRKQFFDDPTSQFSERTAIKYAEAVLSILQATNVDAQDCQQTEQDAIDAWIDHGNFEKVRRYSFSNPDIKAYQSLVSGNYGELWQAKSLECILKNANSDEALLASVKEIMADPFLIGYTFNSVYELLMRTKKNGQFDLHQKLISQLLANDQFTTFLMKKLASKELGVVRKIDYYLFYKELTQVDNPKIVDEINRSFAQLMKQEVVKNGVVDYELRDDQITLVQSMFKNGLMDGEHLSQILNASTDPTVAMAIASGLQQFPVASAEKCLSKLITIQSAPVLKLTAGTIGALPIDEKVQLSLMSDLIKNHQHEAIPSVASFITSSKCRESSCRPLLETVAKSYGDRDDLGPIFQSLSRVKIEDADRLYLQFESKATSKKNRRGFVSSVLRSPSVSSRYKEVIIDRYLSSSDDYNAEIYSALSSLDQFDSNQVSLFDRLLQNTSEAQSSQMVELLSRSEFSPSIYKDRFISLMSFSSNSATALKLGEELLYTSRLDRKQRQELWGQLLKSKGIGDLQLYNLSSKILQFKTLTAEDEQLLRTFAQRIKSPFFQNGLNDLIKQSSTLNEAAKKEISTSN